MAEHPYGWEVGHNFTVQNKGMSHFLTVCLLSSVLEMKSSRLYYDQEAEGSVLVKAVSAKHACACVGLWTVRLKIHIDIILTRFSYRKTQRIYSQDCGCYRPCWPGSLHQHHGSSGTSVVQHPGAFDDLRCGKVPVRKTLVNITQVSLFCYFFCDSLSTLTPL